MRMYDTEAPQAIRYGSSEARNAQCTPLRLVSVGMLLLLGLLATQLGPTARGSETLSYFVTQAPVQSQPTYIQAPHAFPAGTDSSGPYLQNVVTLRPNAGEVLPYYLADETEGVMMPLAVADKRVLSSTGAAGALTFGVLLIGLGTLWSRSQRRAASGDATTELPDDNVIQVDPTVRDQCSSRPEERRTEVGDFYFDSAASCGCKTGKISRSGTQPWRGAPYDALDCGEDSFFMTDGVIGVADGVSASRDLESDSSILANQLMEYAKLCSVEQMDPVAIMQQAFDRIRASCVKGKGATTAIIATVTADGAFTVANLGDSSLMVIRDGEVVLQAESSIWQFNVPYMLEGYCVDDPDWKPSVMVPLERQNVPSDCVVQETQLEQGDLIIMASDGLWDNLYPHEILKILKMAPDQSPEGLVGTLHKKCKMASENRYKKSPYMKNADEAGLEHQGGKADDITIVVARATRRG